MEPSEPPTHTPVEVRYCPVCTFPVEYCEYGPSFTQCKQWIAKNCPEVYPELVEEFQRLTAEGAQDVGEAATETSAAAIEETKDVPAASSKKSSKKAAPKVTISVNKKNFNRSVTIVSGLEAFNVDLKAAAKKCGKKFACGSSVVKSPNEDHIEVQGEVESDIISFLHSEFSVPEDAFRIVEAKSKGKAAAKK